MITINSVQRWSLLSDVLSYFGFKIKVLDLFIDSPYKTVMLYTPLTKLMTWTD